MDFSRYARQADGRSFTYVHRQEYVHGRAMPVAGTAGPDSSAQRVERIGAPVQADAAVGLARLGREAALEDPPDILLRDADAVVPTLQMEHRPVQLVLDIGNEADHATIHACGADRIGGIDDHVLQNESQHHTRKQQRTDALERLVDLDSQPLTRGIRNYLERIADELWQPDRLNHMLGARIA